MKDRDVRERHEGPVQERTIVGTVWRGAPQVMNGYGNTRLFRRLSRRSCQYNGQKFTEASDFCFFSVTMAPQQIADCNQL